MIPLLMGSQLQQWSALGVIFITVILTWAFNQIWMQPMVKKRFLQSQGLTVLPYHPLVGDTPEIMRLHNHARTTLASSPFDHNLIARLYPFGEKAMRIYGKSFVFWWGREPRLLVTDPEIVKHILSSKFKEFKKSPGSFLIMDKIFGTGLLSAEGENWKKQRQILNPAFFADKLKGMFREMVVSTKKMVCSWRELVKDGEGGEIEIAGHLKSLTADVIACTCFGSSYQEGKRIFENQVLLLDLIFKNAISLLFIPGGRILPFSYNRQIWALESGIEKELRKIVENRRDSVVKGGAVSYGTDILGLILNLNEEDQHLQELNSSDSNWDDKKRKENLKLSIREIMDEMKTFFFAGHETTASLLTWTMLLLAIYPEWQDRLRIEVMEICGSEKEIKVEHLSKMKLMSMVINEVVRLYPPVPDLVARMTAENSHIVNVTESLQVPGGTGFSIPSLLLHREKEFWGDDADEFKPERFAEGISKACSHPYAYIPFGSGPRFCIGQNFALMEAKLVIASILQNFPFFKLSPNYKHAPHNLITCYPLHGLQLIFSNPST